MKKLLKWKWPIKKDQEQGQKISHWNDVWLEINVQGLLPSRLIMIQKSGYHWKHWLPMWEFDIIDLLPSFDFIPEPLYFSLYLLLFSYFFSFFLWPGDLNFFSLSFFLLLFIKWKRVWSDVRWSFLFELKTSFLFERLFITW